MFDTRRTATGDDRCASMAAAVDALAAEDPTLLGATAQLARLREVGKLADRLRAEQLRLLAAADRSGALADDGAATSAAWLRHNTTMTAAQAATHAKLARRLRELPIIADAMAEGQIGVVHGAAIDRLARDVGVEQVEAVQTELIEAAVRLRDVREFQRLCIGWRHALRPDLLDEANDRAHDGRRLSHAATMGGRFHLNGSFDAEGGATIATAIDAFTTQDPPDTPVELRRSPSQRRADALVEMARRSLTVAGDVAGQRPQVVTRVDIDPTTGRPGPHPAEMDWVGPIGPATLERLVSDCSLVRIIVRGDSQPLDVGTSTRVWPTALRRAITDRDRGCRFFSCDRPPAWCDIDHVRPVSDGGPTTVTNGILLCRHHHRAKRRDGWWPTLRPDGTVDWAHADGRTGTDPPPARLATEVDRLLDALADHPAASVAP